MNYYNYFTEIEEHFVRRRGKHMYISPLDWSLIAAWRDAQVPLHVALRGIDIAMDIWHSRPRRATDKLSTLFYCHDSVMSEYARHLEAHLGAGQEGSAAAQPDIEEKTGQADADKKALSGLIQARISEIEALLAKHYPSGESEEVDRVLSRLREILASVQAEARPEMESLDRDLGLLDEILVSALRQRTPGEQIAEWAQDAKKELKIYKKNLSKEMYQKILDNFMRAKIHLRFHVGELSLYKL